MLIGAASAVGAVFVGMPGVAAAQPPAPPPPPPLPNVNAWAPAKLPDYAVTDGSWYAFATPQGVTCVLQRNGGYGCSGALPGAPGGANLVSGGPGAPGFSSTSAPLYAAAEAPKPLPPNTRLSFQTVSCGTDGTITSCVDTRTQNGFVISPTASWVVGGNPLVDRPEGTSPYFN
ncbi:hypothetical protein O6P37_27775 [Mycobacterium sp. CPCC 205372]|uniref:Secreted protein n=1 Tax=Mycobacterium hippophais TaxID=3016340 RepID=A0ABT4Q1E4_9MYCO|nr:hypothetical protein [Mycobacterium hippophais]MCZ8382676.1 hypothetical protein [Mycobacterium hippophais]